MSESARRWILRERTAAAHLRLDAAVGQFDSLESYTSYLRSAAAFRGALELELSRCAWPSQFGGWRPTLVADALMQDMRDLGVEPLPEVAGETLQLSDDGLFGALYVLEGSTLGARLLVDRAAALGLNAEFGARHLSALTASRDGWRNFLGQLEAADPLDIDIAVAGSMATFALAQQAFDRRI
jgi:heme oxygenase (biliverdin-IX-beta and delta-forming)